MCLPRHSHLQASLPAHNNTALVYFLTQHNTTPLRYYTLTLHCTSLHCTRLHQARLHITQSESTTRWGELKQFESNYTQLPSTCTLCTTSLCCMLYVLHCTETKTAVCCSSLHTIYNNAMNHCPALYICCLAPSKLIRATMHQRKGLGVQFNRGIEKQHKEKPAIVCVSS